MSSGASAGLDRPASREADEDAVRRITLCADDYGISPGVSRGIRDLLARGRINATSVMVTTPSFSAAEADALNALWEADSGISVGLHFTLTAPFRPATPTYRPVSADGAFPSLQRKFATGLLARLDPDAIRAEAASQLAAFVNAFGRAPDFVDGHQHVHHLPQVGEALLAIMADEAPAAWIRQCGRATRLSQRWGDPKGLFLDVLSTRLRARSAARGVATNPAFAGTYDFTRVWEYEPLFASFLEDLPDGGLVMCHPGFVDDELQRLDTLTVMREREYAFFVGDRFPQLLASRGFALA